MTRERWHRTPALEQPSSDRGHIDFPSSVELAAGLPLHADPYIGRTVGPCLVEELLGEGAFGRVYRAHHLRLQAPVALKLLTQVTAPKALARFTREAQAAARLADLNVVKVYELGVNERVPFIVQELVEGKSLAEVIEKGPLPFDEAIRIACGITSGLDAIHAAGLVHRDLKPDNVMITPDGEPKIVDFGLVRVIGDEGGFTSEGLLMGTPAFIAPEQIQPKGEGCDFKADLYALGCVLYLLLTGDVPHMEDPDGTLVAFLARRMAGPPRAIQELRAKIPDALARMVMALLDVDPGGRPGARQVHGILEVIHGELSGESKPLRSSRFPAQRGSGSSARVPAVKRKTSARVRRKSSGRLPASARSNNASSRHRRASKPGRSTAGSARAAARSGSSSARTPRAGARSRRLPASYRAPSDVGGVRDRRRQVVVIGALGALGVLVLALAMFGNRSKPAPRPAPPQPTRQVAAAATAAPAARTSPRTRRTSSVRRRAASVSSNHTQVEQPSAADPFFPVAQRAGELERAGRLWEAILLYRKYLAKHPKGPGAARARAALTQLASRLKQHLDADLARLNEQLKAGRRDEAVKLLLKTVGKYGGPEAAQALKTLARQLEARGGAGSAKTLASITND